MPVDPRFSRIARRLTALELQSREGVAVDDADLFAEDDGNFVNTYTAAGLAHALHEYGVTEALAERGLAKHRLLISREDPFRHRLQMVLDDVGETIMDLRLHLIDVDVAGVRASVVVVDWLMMQNPLATFTAIRPRLPGQKYPGTKMGAHVHQLLLLLCRRLGRDGLQNTPEHFHLARLYRRAGYVADVEDHVVEAVCAAGDAAGIGFASLAWAVERGCVKDDEGHAFAWKPAPLYCPVTRKLETALSTSQKQHPTKKPRFVVDKDALVRSLATDPVAGLDAFRLSA